MGNLGYLFYKDYYNLNNKEVKDYDNVYDEKLGAKTRDILNFKLNKAEKNTDFSNNFELKTTYPGLLIGSGYTHETGSEDEFKLGFQFDYTSGLPIIPGSSIKGVLKSAFEHEEYIKKLDGLEECTEDDIERLRRNIFEGYGYSKGREELLSVYKRDIFYDSVILDKIEENGESGERKILNDDYITPHGENPLKNPVPIKFLKVAPNVIFGFRFVLNDFEYGQIKVTAEIKKELFKTIIKDLGLGAKTNIGYGQFEGI